MSTESDAQVPLDSVVPAWLSIGEVSELLGMRSSAVRQLVRDGKLVALKHGGSREPEVPADFFDGHQPVKGLAGTLTVLADAGYDPEASVNWLFTEDETLPGSPIQALRGNRGTEVRRRAQALAF